MRGKTLPYRTLEAATAVIIKMRCSRNSQENTCNVEKRPRHSEGSDYTPEIPDKNEKVF